MIYLTTHLGKLFGVVNSFFIKGNCLHDNAFANTSTKVGFLAARFSRLSASPRHGSERNFCPQRSDFGN